MQVVKDFKQSAVKLEPVVISQPGCTYPCEPVKHRDWNRVACTLVLGHPFSTSED